MFLKIRNTGDLIDVESITELVSPDTTQVRGKSQAGEDEKSIKSVCKKDLLFRRANHCLDVGSIQMSETKLTLRKVSAIDAGSFSFTVLNSKAPRRKFDHLHCG